jgi:hypothetical protein
MMASYRDPRDIALSLVDHGARSRAKGHADYGRIVAYRLAASRPQTTLSVSPRRKHKV